MAGEGVDPLPVNLGRYGLRPSLPELERGYRRAITGMLFRRFATFPGRGSTPSLTRRLAQDSSSGTCADQHLGDGLSWSYEPLRSSTRAVMMWSPACWCLTRSCISSWSPPPPPSTPVVGRPLRPPGGAARGGRPGGGVVGRGPGGVYLGRLPRAGVSTDGYPSLPSIPSARVELLDLRFALRHDDRPLDLQRRGELAVLLG